MPRQFEMITRGFHNGNIVEAGGVVTLRDDERPGAHMKPYTPFVPPAAPRVVSATLDYDDMYIGTSLGALSDQRTGTATNYATLAGMQGLGFETHAINSDPLLSNETSPASVSAFYPAYNSPVGIGSNQKATVPSDFNGTAFLATADVGALNRIRRVFGTRTYVNNRTLIN